MAARTKAWVCRRSLDKTVGSNTAGAIDVCLVCVAHVQDTATGRSLVQRSPTECGVIECDQQASITRVHWPTGG